MSESCPSGKILDQPNLKEFSFTELKLITRNFRPASVVGQGGFGKVYKGWVNDKTLAPSKSNSGMAVAIKKLNAESVQGFQDWQVKSSSFMDHLLYCIQYSEYDEIISPFPNLATISLSCFLWNSYLLNKSRWPGHY